MEHVKNKLIEEITWKITEYQKKITIRSSQEADAQNRIAISNLYIALSNLVK